MGRIGAWQARNPLSEFATVLWAFIALFGLLPLATAASLVAAGEAVGILVGGFIIVWVLDSGIDWFVWRPLKRIWRAFS